MQGSQDVRMPRHRYSIPMYIGAGGIATASHYATMIMLVELLGVLPLIATATGFVVGAVVKYVLNHGVVFRSAERHDAAVPRFAVMLGIMFVLNAACFAALSPLTEPYYIVAQVITTILLIPPGYFMSRLWVFRRAER
jgi:putative flippase GtrA